MERTKLIFCASERLNDVDGANDLECFINDNNEIFIGIGSITDPIPYSFTCLDRLTAIKLVKHLKREIAKMEVDNG